MEMGLFCNETLFKQHNVPLPTDWASLLNAINVFKSKNIIPISASLGAEAHYYFDHLIMAVGGAKAMNVNPKSDAEIPESWVKGLGLLKVLYDAGAFPAEYRLHGQYRSAPVFPQGGSRHVSGRLLVQRGGSRR